LSYEQAQNIFAKNMSKYMKRGIVKLWVKVFVLGKLTESRNQTRWQNCKEALLLKFFLICA